MIISELIHYLKIVAIQNKERKFMDTISLIIAAITFIATSLTFFIGLRSEMKRNRDEMIDAILFDEQRHSAHEQDITIMQERITHIEQLINYRLDEINKKLDTLTENFFEHIKELSL